MAQHRQRKPGVTLIELLVAISTITALLGILLPSLSAARNQAQSTKCASNLRQIAAIAISVGVDDPRGIIHRQSTNGAFDHVGLGKFDFGGADGYDPDDPQNIYNEQAPGFHLGAVTRPNNIAEFGSALSTRSDFSHYRCPGNEGAFKSANQNETTWGAETPTRIESMFKAVGTSYVGDALPIAPDGPNTEPAYRIGAFMRPSSRIPDTSILVLFAEFRLAQAGAHSQEFIKSSGFTFTVQTVSGSHGRRSVFYTSFTDGHVAPVRILSAGTVFAPYAGDPDIPRRFAVGGNGWRNNAFPNSDPYVIEHIIGDP